MAAIEGEFAAFLSDWRELNEEKIFSKANGCAALYYGLRCMNRRTYTVRLSYKISLDFTFGARFPGPRTVLAYLEYLSTLDGPDLVESSCSTSKSARMTRKATSTTSLTSAMIITTLMKMTLPETPTIVSRKKLLQSVLKITILLRKKVVGRFI